MTYRKLDFYKDRFMVNLLARDLENAIEVNEALEGHALVGVLTKDYATVEDCVKVVKSYQEKIPFVSVGLGAGDPKQYKMVAEVAALTDPGHANEVFSGAFYCKGALDNAGCTKTLINCLISPTGEVGTVKVSTGPVTSSEAEIILPVDDALKLMKDANIQSIKYFNIGGTKHLDELKAVAEAAVRVGIPVLEPTGGLDADNVKEVVKICLDAGVERVIPHVYTSIIDKETKLTKIDLVKKIYEDLKSLV